MGLFILCVYAPRPFRASSCTVGAETQEDMLLILFSCTFSKGRIVMTALPTYYGGFDPGSARAGLHLVSADGVELTTETMTIESLIATGNAEALLKRGDIHA